MSFSQSELPEERSTPERSSCICALSSSLCRSSDVMTSGLPRSAYKNPMYALAPELDWVALVMQKWSFPLWIASRRSLTDTSRSTNPSSSARLLRIPNTTGEMEMDSACLIRCSVSPTVSHRLLAGHTAS